MADDAINTSFLSKDKLFEFFTRLVGFEKQWLTIGEQDIRYLRIRGADILDTDLWQNAYCSLKDEGDERKWTFYGPQLFHLMKTNLEELWSKECDPMNKCLLRQELNKLMKYQAETERLIKLLFEFLRSERELADSFLTSPEEEMDTSGPLCWSFIGELEERKKNFLLTIRRLDTLRRAAEQLEQTISEIIDMHKQPNGLNLGKLKEEVEAIYKRKEENQTEFLETEKNIPIILENIKEFLSSLIEKFVEDIEDWKQEQQDFYVGLIEEKPQLDNLQNRCSKVGKLLYDLLQCDLEEGIRSVEREDIRIDIQEKKDELFKMFQHFLQKTFVVSDQLKQTIKVEMGNKKRNKDDEDYSASSSGSGDQSGKKDKKFNCPKFAATTRLVSGDLLGGKEKVRAMFCKEDDIGEIGQMYNWELLHSKCFPLKGNESTFDKSCAIATFKTIQLTEFSRNNDKAVHEDKYRLIFRTSVKLLDHREIHLWAMSLPIVVITGASQGCNAYGSLLWQCFVVKDAFAAVPPLCPDSMAWSDLRDMLCKKMNVLSKRRELSDDELRHIGHRLMGTSKDVKPDAVIPFKKFCVDKMMMIGDNEDRKKSATFWMWFQAVFNLIKMHLKRYWDEDLIAGFLDKEMVKRKLENCQPFTFLLRFSDQSITDGQGQSMCGAVSASFVCQDSKVEHARPFTAEEVKKNGLAHLLKKMVSKDTNESILLWLYPGNKSRDQAFKEFYEQDSSAKKRKGDYRYLDTLIVLAINMNKMDNLTLKDEPSNRHTGAPPGGQSPDHMDDNSHGPVTRAKAVAKKRSASMQPKGSATIKTKRAARTKQEDSPPTQTVPDIDLLEDSLSSIQSPTDQARQTFFGGQFDTSPVVSPVSSPGNIPLIIDQAQEQIYPDSATRKSQSFDASIGLGSPPRNMAIYESPRPSMQHPLLTSILKTDPASMIKENLRQKIQNGKTLQKYSQGKVIYNPSTGMENIKEQDFTNALTTKTQISGGNCGGKAMITSTEVSSPQHFNSPGSSPVSLSNSFSNTGQLIISSIMDEGSGIIQVQGTNFMPIGSPMLSTGSPTHSTGSPAMPDSTVNEVAVVPSDVMPQLGSEIIYPILETNIDAFMKISPLDGESLESTINPSFFDNSGGTDFTGSG